MKCARVFVILRAAAERCEKAGLVMVLEPLNRRDNPSMFLTRVPQTFQICRAVNSPSCKILFDIYHQQITEGNLIPNFDQAWREVAYVQVGDNPGRKEPTTGEINYANVFAHLKRILRLDRLRLRGPNGARDEFLLAATAQNLRKMAKLIPMPATPAPA